MVGGGNRSYSGGVMQLEKDHVIGEEWQGWRHTTLDYQWDGDSQAHQYDLYWNDDGKGRVYKDGDLICVDVMLPGGALCN